MTETLNFYKQSILRQLDHEPGLRASLLVLKVISVTNPVRFDPTDYNSALNGLIEDNEIQPVFFVSPDKATITLYFPKGTHFSFNGSKI